MEEYINIPVNYTSVEMKYTRNGGNVSGGNSNLCHWWVDVPSAWGHSLEACNAGNAGPTSVFTYGRYLFWSAIIPPFPTYALSARFTADPGNRSNCSISSGSRPLGWGLICSGGLYY
jgi:hypothetical protein